MDPEFVDPMQKVKMNPPELIARINEILDTGEWSAPDPDRDADMADYDALVIVGGAGSALDVAGNGLVHRLVLDAYRTARPSARSAMPWRPGRSPAIPTTHASVIYGKHVTAHPHAWDFVDDLPYDVVRATPDNPRLQLVTSGFVFPLQYLVEDAVGPDGSVACRPVHVAGAAERRVRRPVRDRAVGRVGAGVRAANSSRCSPTQRAVAHA